MPILFGFITGISLGLTGGGGAVFAVPMLVYGLGIPTRQAVLISLVSVGATALLGFLQKWRRGEAELRTGLLFAAAGILGAPLGSWTAHQIPDSLLMLLFALLMTIIATVMWRKGSRSSGQAAVCIPLDHTVTAADYRLDGPRCQRDACGNLILTSRCARLLLLTGVLAGILSGMFGVGGGFIIVPALMVFSSMSMSRAVGTSLMVISLVSASGVISQLSTGQHLQWQTAALFVAGGLPGLTAGQTAARYLSASTLQKVFAVAILLVAMFVLAKNFAW
ncbi:MAG: sulfite exporter TauE/SafE family protein [Planctomyces sp.]